MEVADHLLVGELCPPLPDDTNSTFHVFLLLSIERNIPVECWAKWNCVDGERGSQPGKVEFFTFKRPNEREKKKK